MKISINDVSGFKPRINACDQCVFRRKIPGSAHSSCSKVDAIVSVDSYGFNMGWAFHPFDFDPNWINECDSFLSKDVKFENVNDAITKIYILIFYIKQKIVNQKNLQKLQKLNDLMNEFTSEMGKRKIDELSMQELTQMYIKVMKG